MFFYEENNKLNQERTQSMEKDLAKDVLIHGVVSVLIAVIVTYAVSTVIPTEDLIWALYAVVFASFFSSASTAYMEKQE